MTVNPTRQGRLAKTLASNVCRLSQVSSTAVVVIVGHDPPPNVKSATRLPEVACSAHVADLHFRKFMDDEKIAYTEAELLENNAWVRSNIKSEIFVDVFGQEEGLKVRAETDPQVTKALKVTAAGQIAGGKCPQDCGGADGRASSEPVDGKVFIQKARVIRAFFVSSGFARARRPRDSRRDAGATGLFSR